MAEPSSTNAVKNSKKRPRPARKQADQVESTGGPISGTNTEFNIWYGKYLGDRPAKRTEQSSTRCDPEKDSGLTKADKSGESRYICLYFARGKCVLGAECPYYHRIPVPEDEARLDPLHDIFGRERHSTDRDDMGGVGTFNRNNRTLYVGGLKSIPGVNLEKVLRQQFGAFGEIEYLTVKFVKMIGFVRYKYRVAAEFAKEAMADQSLGHKELLNVRWANEDPNPVAKRHEEEEVSRQAASAMVEAWQKQGVPEYMYSSQVSLLEQIPAPHPYTPQYHQMMLQYQQQAPTQQQQPSGQTAGTQSQTGYNYNPYYYGQQQYYNYGADASQQYQQDYQYYYPNTDQQYTLADIGVPYSTAADHFKDEDASSSSDAKSADESKEGKEEKEEKADAGASSSSTAATTASDSKSAKDKDASADSKKSSED